MTDALLDAIVATPDDDAPRLVWADREGGERGELVVVQCALAAGGVSDALLAREATLLARQNAWLPEEVRPLARFGFRRGFPELASFFGNVEDLARAAALVVAHCPTVRGLDLGNLARETDAWGGPTAEACWEEVAAKLAAVYAVLPAGRITSLAAGTGVSIDTQYAMQTKWFGDEFLAQVVATPVLSELRSLTFTGITPASYPRLAQLTKLEFLGTGPGGRYPIQLSADDAIALLRAAPHLRRLAVHLEGEAVEQFMASPEYDRLQEIDLE